MSVFFKDQAGHIAIEYGMIAALIVIGLIASLTSMGLSVEEMLSPLGKALAAPAP